MLFITIWKAWNKKSNKCKFKKSCFEVVLVQMKRAMLSWNLCFVACWKLRMKTNSSTVIFLKIVKVFQSYNPVCNLYGTVPDCYGISGWYVPEEIAFSIVDSYLFILHCAHGSVCNLHRVLLQTSTWCKSLMHCSTLQLRGEGYPACWSIVEHNGADMICLQSEKAADGRLDKVQLKLQ